MGHTEPKLAGGLKMKAFYESPYGDDVVTHQMNHHVRGRLQCRYVHWFERERITDDMSTLSVFEECLLHKQPEEACTFHVSVEHHTKPRNLTSRWTVVDSG